MVAFQPYTDSIQKIDPPDPIMPPAVQSHRFLSLNLCYLIITHHQLPFDSFVTKLRWCNLQLKKNFKYLNWSSQIFSLDSISVP